MGDKEYINITEETYNKIKNRINKEENYQSKKNLLNSVIATMTIVISLTAVYTFYAQDYKQLEISNLLEKEITFKTENIRNETNLASIKIDTLLAEMQSQIKLIESLDKVKIGKTNENITKEIVILNSKISIIESEISKIHKSNILEKIKAIEKAIQGNPIKVLSVPLIKNDFRNYKTNTEKELFRLEKTVEKLDSRLSFFVTTTITLTLGIFTTIIAPLFLTFIQRRREKLNVK